MGEINPDSVEQKVEHIPTPEEIREIIRQMAKGEYSETRRCIDDKGNLYRLDAIVVGVNKGEFLELYYIRKGVHPNGDQSAETEIHSIHTKDGSYVSAGPQASLVNGNWVL
ncbi:MAG: hypothetical protein WC783_05835, partial [Candidatus Paceibacterota bacterium]